MRRADDGEISLWEDDWRGARLLPDTVVTPWVTVVRLKLADRRWSRSVAILADSLPADDFRHLRVWLKWRAKLAAKANGTPDGHIFPSRWPDQGAHPPDAIMLFAGPITFNLFAESISRAPTSVRGYPS